MRRGRGAGTPIGWTVALYATWACSGTVQARPEPLVTAPACTLFGTPSLAADTATITFDAFGTTPEQCALTLAAETLRPWPNVSRGSWTVHIAVTPTAATVRRLGGEDARDAIDAGSARMATDDLDLTAYAAARADLDVTPLPWDRTYLRLSGASPTLLGGSAGPDAVRVHARPAEAPACEGVLPAERTDVGSVASKRVVYDVVDRTARELAERMVAVAEVADATAVGLSTDQLDLALRAGSELAYVVSVPRTSYCDELRTLGQRAPWMSSRSVLPLIDTRAYAIAPRPPRP